jgi:hypothetical protein
VRYNKREWNKFRTFKIKIKIKKEKKKIPTAAAQSKSLKHVSTLVRVLFCSVGL